MVNTVAQTPETDQNIKQHIKHKYVPVTRTYVVSLRFNSAQFINTHSYKSLLCLIDYLALGFPVFQLLLFNVCLGKEISVSVGSLVKLVENNTVTLTFWIRLSYLWFL